MESIWLADYHKEEEKGDPDRLVKLTFLTLHALVTPVTLAEQRYPEGIALTALPLYHSAFL
jgi:hypothetical protein